jgi:hypothetical protein
MDIKRIMDIREDIKIDTLCIHTCLGIVASMLAKRVVHRVNVKPACALQDIMSLELYMHLFKMNMTQSILVCPA